MEIIVWVREVKHVLELYAYVQYSVSVFTWISGYTQHTIQWQLYF